MTIGDVLAVIAAVGVLGVCGVATLLLAALAFPERTQRAGETIAAAPGCCLGRGLGVLLLVGLSALFLEHSPAGPVRLLGHALWAALALVAALGGAGIARLLAERIRTVGTEMFPFAALTHGAALCVLAALLPLIGWFLVMPLAALMALGGVLAPRRFPEKPLEARHEAPAVF